MGKYCGSSLPSICVQALSEALCCHFSALNSRSALLLLTPSGQAGRAGTTPSPLLGGRCLILLEQFSWNYYNNHLAQLPDTPGLTLGHLLGDKKKDPLCSETFSQNVEVLMLW